MRRFRRFAALLPAAALLAGCSDGELSRDLGLTRTSPDEYTVVTHAPLTIPSQFTLLPPAPGAPRPQEKSAALAAEAALDPAVELQSGTPPNSPGQDALVAAAGPPPQPDIRTWLDLHAKEINRQGGGLGGTLAFWKNPPPPGKPLDSAREAARLRAIGIPTLSPPPTP